MSLSPSSSSFVLGWGSTPDLFPRPLSRNVQTAGGSIPSEYFPFRQTAPKRALWEYDNLIQSLYLLNYIDPASLRQNVQRAVNRGESYHQLRRTIVGDARVERPNLTKKLSVTIDVLLFPGGEFYAFAR